MNNSLYDDYKIRRPFSILNTRFFTMKFRCILSKLSEKTAKEYRTFACIYISLKQPNFEGEVRETTAKFLSKIQHLLIAFKKLLDNPTFSPDFDTILNFTDE